MSYEEIMEAYRLFVTESPSIGSQAAAILTLAWVASQSPDIIHSIAANAFSGSPCDIHDAIGKRRKV